MLGWAGHSALEGGEVGGDAVDIGGQQRIVGLLW